MPGADLLEEALPEVELETRGEAVIEGDSGAVAVPLAGAEALRVPSVVTLSVAVALPVEKAE